MYNLFEQQFSFFLWWFLCLICKVEVSKKFIEHQKICSTIIEIDLFFWIIWYLSVIALVDWFIEFLLIYWLVGRLIGIDWLNDWSTDRSICLFISPFQNRKRAFIFFPKRKGAINFLQNEKELHFLKKKGLNFPPAPIPPPKRTVFKSDW